MSGSKPKLALTIGDPAGIGPELVASLITRGALEPYDLRLIGSASSLLARLPERIGGDFEIIREGRPFSGARTAGIPVIVDTAGGLEAVPGKPSAEGGAVSGRSVEAAVEMAGRGDVDGIVTGPISKEALVLAGYTYRGHTEMLAAMLDSPDCQMMMVSGDLRIVILTRDIPISEVPAAVTRDRLERCVRVTAASLGELWGIDSPRILVSGLNPHAGDGGVIGMEEVEVISPAILALRGEGFDVEGPIPADTLYRKWEGRRQDAIIALYHDQGMIPFKMEGFDKGVNMTIGLPVVRTSVCHGTAYDIVGSGEFSTGSLEAALELASHCCTVKGGKRD